jgi:hypothetical protein
VIRSVGRSSIIKDDTQFEVEGRRSRVESSRVIETRISTSLSFPSARHEGAAVNA